MVFENDFAVLPFGIVYLIIFCQNIQKKSKERLSTYIRQRITEAICVIILGSISILVFIKFLQKGQISLVEFGPTRIDGIAMLTESKMCDLRLKS